MQLIGERLLGAAFYFLGEQTRARGHFERMLERYVRPPNRSDVIRFRFDQRVGARMTLSRVLWLQGFADQAMRTVQRAVDDALAIQHALSLCNLLGAAACPLAIANGDLAAADRYAAMLSHYAGRHGADVWLTYGRCFEGMVLIKRDQFDVGVPMLSAAVAELRTARFAQYYTAFLAALAEGLAGAGEAVQAAAVLDEALARSDEAEEGWILAELLRIKGELVLMLAPRERCRGCGGLLPAVARARPPPGSAGLGAPGGDEPRTASAPTAQDERGAGSCWPRSTGASPRDSTPPTSSRQRRCSRRSEFFELRAVRPPPGHPSSA